MYQMDHLNQLILYFSTLPIFFLSYLHHHYILHQLKWINHLFLTVVFYLNASHPIRDQSELLYKEVHQQQESDQAGRKKNISILTSQDKHDDQTNTAQHCIFKYISKYLNVNIYLPIYCLDIFEIIFQNINIFLKHFLKNNLYFALHTFQSKKIHSHHI